MEMEGFEKRVLMSAGWRVITSRAILPWVLAIDGLPQRPRVLELGSGAGFNAEVLLRRFPQWQLVATDYDPDMVDVLRRRMARFGNRVRVERADATAIAIDGPRFDLVISIAVWHHVGAWEEALRQSANALHPGGRLLLADLTSGFFRGPLGRLFPPARTYTVAELRPALRAAGFARWELTRVGSIGYRVLAERDGTTVPHGLLPG